MKTLKMMRVHHYIKNFLIFAALACSGKLFQPDKTASVLWGFLAFCALSSIIYIINDIRDRENDRNHPTKCNRPIASGAVSVKYACAVTVILGAFVVLFNGYTAKPVAGILLLLYFVLNLGYSMGLKNIPLVDISILVAGFLIRVIYGAWISNIVISNWLYLTVIAISFYFALGKRRNEMKHLKNQDTRRVLKNYSIDFLDKNMYMCLALANAFYALWSMDPTTIEAHNQSLIFTVPIVLLITMEYSIDVEGESDGDPVEVLLHDKKLIVLCAVYAAAMFSILYIL